MPINNLLSSPSSLKNINKVTIKDLNNFQFRCSDQRCWIAHNLTNRSTRQSVTPFACSYCIVLLEHK
jgi:hypothetical protein